MRNSQSVSSVSYERNACPLICFQAFSYDPLIRPLFMPLYGLFIIDSVHDHMGVAFTEHSLSPLFIADLLSEKSPDFLFCCFYRPLGEERPAAAPPVQRRVHLFYKLAEISVLLAYGVFIASIFTA